MTARPSPPGDPIGYYFREALLIGGEATRLYLIRHAQSQGNTGEDLTTGDPELTDVGWEQARRLGERLARQRIDLIFTSPLRRAIQTAEAIAAVNGLDVRVEPELREVELGRADYDIRALTEAEQVALASRIATEGKWDAFPGSEGSAYARNRVREFTDRIVEQYEGHRVALVSHAGFIQTFVSVVLGVERDFVFYPFNASITSVRAKGERRVLWRLNDVGHLDGMPAGFGGIS